eukprot:3094699-Heterocapsa_arctica.AAC.2
MNRSAHGAHRMSRMVLRHLAIVPRHFAKRSTPDEPVGAWSSPDEQVGATSPCDCATSLCAAELTG